MRFERGDLSVSTDDAGAVRLADGQAAVELSADGLRWTVAAVGPAVLVDLDRREAAGAAVQ